MKTETTGTVMAGILTLDQPLDLPDQSRVRVAVEPLEGWQAGPVPGWMPGRRFAQNTPSMPPDDDTRGTNCMNAVDTNIFVYFVDRDEPSKRAKAIELLDCLVREEVETILLWQVAAEFLNCLRRWENEGRINRHEVLGNYNRLEAMFRCVPPSQPVLRKSLDLCSRYSLSHWDAMLVAACIEAGVHTLYSEDLSSGTQYDSVKVVNPFA